MNSITRNLFASVFIALAFTLTLAVIAQEAPPAAETAVIAPAAPAAPTAPAAPVAPEAAEHAAKSDDEDLRRLDAPEADAAVAAEATEDRDSDDTKVEVRQKVRRQYRHKNEFPMGNHTVPVGTTVREAVSIFGSTTVNGEVDGEAVSIGGDTTVNGSTGSEAVAVLGSVKVTGSVGGEVVAVLGDVELGPKAVVQNDVVVIGGKLIRDPEAVVHGSVHEFTPFGANGYAGLKAWFHRCLLMGRPLAFGADLGWVWLIAGAVFALYVLLALMFPRAFEKCLDTLEQRPGYSLLAVLLTVLITPILIVLLVATGVGILLLPFIGAGLFLGGLFGKAVMHAWLGRRITRYFGDGPLSHVAMATLVGSLVILLLYTVPVLGFVLWKVLDIVGLGVVVYTLILSMRREKPVAAAAGIPAAAGVVPPVVPGATAGVAAGNEFAGATAATPAAAAVPVPPAISASTLPRAGFWIRIAASFLDLIIIGATCGVLGLGGSTPLFFAAYCVVLWALKGTTIGGIVCGLKVVRLDDRPVDWSVALVRSLGGFLSLAVAGLGFIWVAFDDQKQSWHDKIAGTTIVQVPRGMALL